MGIFSRFRRRNPAQPSDVYEGLRLQALRIGADTIGLSPGPEAPIYGIVMETGYDEAVATFVCLGDGTVSLYLSTGGGLIGAGQHDHVRAACLEMLAITNEYAADFIAACEPVTGEFPLPQAGEVFFYLLTPGRAFLGSGPEIELAEQRHPFSALFNNVHQVMGHARMVDEALRQGG